MDWEAGYCTKYEPAEMTSVAEIKKAVVTAASVITVDDKTLKPLHSARNRENISAVLRVGEAGYHAGTHTNVMIGRALNAANTVSSVCTRLSV